MTFASKRFNFISNNIYFLKQTFDTLCITCCVTHLCVLINVQRRLFLLLPVAHKSCRVLPSVFLWRVRNLVHKRATQRKPPVCSVVWSKNNVFYTFQVVTFHADSNVRLGSWIHQFLLWTLPLLSAVLPVKQAIVMRPQTISRSLGCRRGTFCKPNQM